MSVYIPPLLSRSRYRLTSWMFVLMVGPLGTLPGVMLGSFSGSMFWRPFHGTPGQNSEWAHISAKLRVCLSERINIHKIWNNLVGHKWICKVSPLLYAHSVLTWGPVNVGPVWDLFAGALALAPAVWGHQGAGGGLRAGHQIVRAVCVLHLRGLPRSAQARGSRYGT